MTTKKKILFVHQSFPGQFIHLAKALINEGFDVRSLSTSSITVDGIKAYRYVPSKSSTPNIHPWIIDFESQIIRGEAALIASNKIKSDGFYPDLIIAHPGWGESLFLKDIWPQAKLLIYCEFFYKASGADVDFDPEFLSNDLHASSKLKIKNLMNLLHFDLADEAFSPTHWQKSLFPYPFQEKIKVIHDGINTEILRPNKAAEIFLRTHDGKNLLLKNGDEILTFVNRNLEPYRGYHIFMRSLPELLKVRPNLQVLIIGGDGFGYGSPPPMGQKWRDIFLSEVANNLDMHRVHFLGSIPYHKFINILQVSMVHVYLTYPFVLSWSLLEAMSVGCAVVASDTNPVREIIIDNENGLLVDFFDFTKIGLIIDNLINNPKKRSTLGLNAMKTIKFNYDLYSICLPRQLTMVKNLIF